MPLFFKKRKKATKLKETKTGVRESLVPTPALVAVPSTPPPGAESSDHHGDRSASVGTQSEWPVGEYSLLGHEQQQPGHLSEEDSDGSEPGYSTIAPSHRASRKSESALPTSSHRPRLATPSWEVEVPAAPDPPQPELGSPPKHNSSVAPQDDHFGSASEHASITSGLSIHSSDNLMPSGTMAEDEADHRGQLEEQAGLYSVVVKAKKTKPSPELLRKTPLTDSASPRLKGKQPARDSLKHIGIANPASPQPRVSQPALPLQGSRHKHKHGKRHTPEDGRMGKSAPNVPGNDEKCAHGQPQTLRRTEAYHEPIDCGVVDEEREGEEEGEEDEEGEWEEDEEEYSDDDYFPSVEYSSSLTDSPVAHRKHESSNRSTGHVSGRPPVTPNSKPRETRLREGRRHHSGSAMGRNPAPSPHPHYYYSDGGEVPHIPFIQPRDLRPVQPHDNQSYLFSEVQPDGTVQYYTATPASSPSGRAKSFTPSEIPATYSPVPPPGLRVQSGLAYTAGSLPHPHTYSTSMASVRSPSPRPVGDYMYVRTPSNPLLQQQYWQQPPPPPPQPELNQAGQQHARRFPKEPRHPVSAVGKDDPVTRARVTPGSTATPLSNPTVTSGGQGDSTHIRTEPSPAKSGQAQLLNTSPASFLPTATRGSSSPPTAVRRTPTEAATVKGSRKEPLAGSPGRAASLSPVDAADGGASHLDDTAKIFSDMLAMVEQREQSSVAEVATLQTARADLYAGNGAWDHHDESPDTSTEQGLNSRSCDQDGTARLKEEVSQLRKKNSKLTEDNSRLQAHNEEMARDRVKWQDLLEHVKTAREQNASLQSQVQLQKEGIADMKKEHQATVEQLTAESSHWKEQRASLQRELNALREKHLQLHEQYRQVVRARRQTAVSDHQQEAHSVRDRSRKVADRTQKAQLQVTSKENKALIAKLADAKTIIAQLEEKCTSSHKATRKAQEKAAELALELEESRNRDLASLEQLTMATVQAEKAAAERDSFARLAKSQQRTHEKATVKRSQNEHAIGRLQKKLEGYRQQASDKLDKASILLQEQEREHIRHRRQCESEIRHLRTLLVQKQKEVDSVPR